ncbi:MAG: PASTA domain-containing protein [Cyclobacteriaceae bacterium]|nr:PASTA domain-containing protein [Cyclobacteriaceae bacterium]
MNKWLKADHWTDIFKHLIYVIAIATLATLGFFYIYLPLTTHHGETITVPDVIGIAYEDLEVFLTSRNLQFEIVEDSGYSPDYPPLAVLQQFPHPNSKVKEKRKIYLTLNTQSPPMVRMPNLVDGSIKNAQMILSSYDLILGKREYIPDLAFNAVLSQKYNGRNIKEGEMVPKGSVIDLTLGDGLGNQQLKSPNLIGLDEESAKISIIGSALSIGDVRYGSEETGVIEEENEEGEIKITKIRVRPGAVYKQHPAVGASMRIKQTMDIWIYRPDSLSYQTTLLDQ